VTGAAGPPDRAAPAAAPDRAGRSRDDVRPAAALVLADAPRAGACLPGLEPLLGPGGCARLQAVLVRRAVDWAVAVAPGRAFVAFAPAEGEAEVAPLVPDGVELFAQPEAEPPGRLAGAVGDAFARAGPGPLLVAGTAVPRLGAGHAAAALADLADGCDATFGPSLHGSFYLAGLAAPHPELFDAAAEAGRGPLPLSAVLARAHELGLELGLLRYERELAEPLDAQALLVDPLAPREVIAELAPAS
jgi:glycosyltransferase A (GT-A) superfamily protein (DUF2064 family)